LDRLRQLAVSDDLIDSIKTPLGLDIGAVTPAEIAVSLAGELLMLWRKTPVMLTENAKFMPQGHTFRKS
jgi:xanthine dehydrogenase accessory factor